MTADELIAHGNAQREHNNPDSALACYVQAIAVDRNCAAGFNNYGNVLREVGEPESAVPFLQRAIQLDPNNITARFNLSVAWLLMGDYANGWPQYKHAGSTNISMDFYHGIANPDGLDKTSETRLYWSWVNKDMATTYSLLDLWATWSSAVLEYGYT